MTDWQAHLLEDLKTSVEDNTFWRSYLDEAIHDTSSSRGLHLAVFLEPYLRFVLEGKKTIESRFSAHLRPPHKRVRKGDVLVLKRSGGAVVGLCRVSRVWFYALDPHSWKDIRKEFADALCGSEEEFWDKRKAASYATLMKVTDVARIGPIACSKRDRRGWVVLRPLDQTQGLFERSK